jgi:hypothetical protein
LKIYLWVSGVSSKRLKAGLVPIVESLIEEIREVDVCMKICFLCSALLATASFDTRVLLWSTVTGEILKEFAHKIPIPLKIYAGGDNGSFVRSVVFTKYDNFLVTTCDDK